MRSYMKYNTVVYSFYHAKKGIDFGKSLFVLEGISSVIVKYMPAWLARSYPRSTAVQEVAG